MVKGGVVLKKVVECSVRSILDGGFVKFVDGEEGQDSFEVDGGRERNIVVDEGITKLVLWKIFD